MSVCMYLCISVYMSVCMYTCLYVCIHVCIHVCMSVYMSVYDVSQGTFINVNAIHRKVVRHLVNNPEQQTDEKLKTLNILLLSKQYEYNKIILVHKIYHEMTPSNLNKLIRKAPNRYHSKKPNFTITKDLFILKIAFLSRVLLFGMPCLMN